jgi:hypothetical protein
MKKVGSMVVMILVIMVGIVAVKMIAAKLNIPLVSSLAEKV